MNNHYIYSLTDPRDGEVCYIGQGVGKRYRWCLSSKCRGLYGVEPWILELRKDGRVPIITKVLENLTYAQVNVWERGLIDLLGRRCKGIGCLLNIADGGQNGGHKQSAETRRKISEGLKGRIVGEATRQKLSEAGKGRKLRPHTDEERRRISEANKGRVTTEATRQKISEAKKGKPLSMEARRKLSESRKGKKGMTPTEATRQKISEANTGKVRSPESCRKISEAKKGVMHSMETRRKMSESQKRRWTQLV